MATHLPNSPKDSLQRVSEARAAATTTAVRLARCRWPRTGIWSAHQMGGLILMAMASDSQAEPYGEFVDLASVPRTRFFHHHPFIERLRRAVHFDFIAVSGLDIDRFRFGRGQSIDTNLPPGYMEAYAAEKLYLSDPLVAASVDGKDVVCDAEVFVSAPPSARLQQLMTSFGVLNRTLFPLRRGEHVYGAITFIRTVPFNADEVDFLKRICEATHVAITKPLMDRFAADTLKLTYGELICLRLASHGLTSERIAAESGYQVDTVNTYMKSAVKKVGASNRTEAIAEAIRRRLIE
ncbi:LuxR C-terminal-related transcriptional regulator [Neorhizobium sp. JUb45]|uniref:helix-turn-helix transcriptional regulator n=2 Tax=unclassified Neorhizobium TaxID=2629175 RepID=UPI0010E95DD8|nr:LuxR C-terminal-related transcriptional regulator [Neorhizobium sp. JUb45]TCR03103.1 LuxR family transcriptional regulator [Neorhizobium sp. JUb45]